MRTHYFVVSAALTMVVPEIAFSQDNLGPPPASPPTENRPRSDESVISQPQLPPPPPAPTGSGPAPAPAPPGPGTTLPPAPPAPPGVAPQPYPYPQPYYPYPPPGQAGTYPSWAYPPFAPKKVTRWYGWQTLIGVVASDLVTVFGTAGTSGALIYVGIAGHVLTGPIVHWAHGHVSKGFASLGLNVGLPGLGMLAGFAIGGGGMASGFYGLAIGGLGYLAAPALDISILAKETVDAPAPKGARALLPSSLGLMPMLDQNRRGLMLVGQF